MCVFYVRYVWCVLSVLRVYVVSMLCVCAFMKLGLFLEKVERVRAQAGNRVGPARTGTKSLRFLGKLRPQEPQLRGGEWSHRMQVPRPEDSYTPDLASTLR